MMASARTEQRAHDHDLGLARLHQLTCTLVLALVLALPSPALANVGAPTYGGTPAGEPGGIIDVAIVHEELAIDLRPLAAADGRVQVAATYHLDNKGSERTLDLMFASGARELDGFRVMLDGEPLVSAPAATTSLPASWKAPDSTPLPDGGTLWFELREGGAVASFQAHVAPGPHELAIAYAAQAVTHHHHEPVLLHQFAYVLAPARSWSAFGGLDVTVLAPSGWTVAVTPAMTRTGDTLKANFAQLPGDAIALTASAPLGVYPIVRGAMLVLVVLVGIWGGVVAYRRAQRRARERARAGMPPAYAAAAFWLALGWAIVFLVVAIASLLVPDLALSDGQIDHRGYAALFAGIVYTFISILLLAVGLVLGIVAGRRATRRERTTE